MSIILMDIKLSILLYFCVLLNNVFNQNISQSAVTKSNSTDPNKDHCNKTVDIYDDIVSPKLTPETYGKPMHCSYRFRSFRGTTPREWVLRIRFKKFKFGTLVNATDCVGGYMQIVDGNTKTNLSNRKDPGLFCGEIEQMQTFISETSFVKITFQTDNYTDQTYYSFDTRAEQEFDLYPRYGKHPELYPNRRGQIVTGTYCQRLFKDCKLQTCYVQSPAYPGVYPRSLHCTYQLSTRLPFIKLYIENEEFNVDGQRCENIITCPMRPINAGIQHCPYDYIRIYDGKNANSREIGTFCGMGKFPFSVIGSSQDLFVEFITSRAGPLLNTGFHFNVGNWPGHVETAGVRNGTCNWILSSKDLSELGSQEGIFLSIVHWYPPNMRCTYLIQGSANQIVRVYFPSLRINKIESPIEPYDGDCGESLTLYDSDKPDDSKIIKTFCNTFSRAMEKHDFISTKNSLFVSFESKTGSYSGSSIYYWAHYDFFNNTKFGTPIVGTECDEEFSAWKKESGTFRSPVNTLIYKKTSADTIRCQYKFVTDRRIFARIILIIESYHFKSNPYRTASCMSCWSDKIDKLLIWEPPLSTADEQRFTDTQPPKSSICLCSNSTERVTKSSSITSSSEALTLEMQIEPTFSTTNYFKANFSLFEASYKFVHGPLCGPPVYKPTTEGELHFPYFEALGFTEAPRHIHCVWDIQVNRNRDLSLHFEKVKFVSRDCQDGKLEIHLPSYEHSYMSVCGHNVSALKNLNVITSRQMTSRLSAEQNRFVQIHFIGYTTPARANFKIVWSELLHLPRNLDGTVKTKQ